MAPPGHARRRPGTTPTTWPRPASCTATVTIRRPSSTRRVADVSGSLFGVIAILGALRGREADGRGCAIDIALADVATPLQLFQVAAYGAAGIVPRRRETYLNGGAAYYQVYATWDDRHVVVGAVEPKFWRSFCEAAGQPDWITRQEEALPQTRLIADVAAFISTLTLEECRARFNSPDCCTSPVLDLGEALASPHVAGRGLVRAAPHGALQALFPARIDGHPPDSRPPVRTGAGLSTSERRDGSAGRATPIWGALGGGS